MNLEMLFAVLGGLFLSVGAHFLVPHRDLRGAALVGSIGTAATAVVWSLLTALGWPFDGVWIWVVSIVVGPIVGIAVALFLTPRRRAADEALFERLSGKSA